MTAWDEQIGGSHYKDWAIQPSEFIQANDISWLEANAIKYLCRHKAKGGREDLLKAKHCIDLLLEQDYPERDSHDNYAQDSA